MTWSLVASARGVDSVTLDSTGANMLVAVMMGGTLSVTSWDNKGNTWTLLTERQVSGHRCRIAYCLSPSSVGSSHTLTDPSAGVQEAEIHFYAFNAPGSVSFHSEGGADDGTFGGAATNSANFAGSLAVTPDSDDALVVGAVTCFGAINSNYAADSPFTLGQSQVTGASSYGGASSYYNQPTAAAVTPRISWTTSLRWSAVSAAFTVAGAPPPPPPPPSYALHSDCYF